MTYHPKYRASTGLVSGGGALPGGGPSSRQPAAGRNGGRGGGGPAASVAADAEAGPKMEVPRLFSFPWIMQRQLLEIKKARKEAAVGSRAPGAVTGK